MSSDFEWLFIFNPFYWWRIACDTYNSTRNYWYAEPGEIDVSQKVNQTSFAKVGDLWAANLYDNDCIHFLLTSFMLPYYSNVVWPIWQRTSLSFYNSICVYCIVAQQCPIFVEVSLYILLFSEFINHSEVIK